MTDQSPSPPTNLRALRFACACASSAGLGDPWAAVPQTGKLNDGTKELLLNAIARQPRTITQLANLLNVAVPTVHRHVRQLLASDLIHEVQVPAAERESAVARYYRPNFPIVRAADRRALQPALEVLAETIADEVRERQSALREAFAHTSLPAGGESFEALFHYLYAATVRLAREKLESDGTLPPWPEHADGSRWLWWAEEPLATDRE